MCAMQSGCWKLFGPDGNEIGRTDQAGKAGTAVHCAELLLRSSATTSARTKAKGGVPARKGAAGGGEVPKKKKKEKQQEEVEEEEQRGGCNDAVTGKKRRKGVDAVSSTRMKLSGLQSPSNGKKARVATKG